MARHVTILVLIACLFAVPLYSDMESAACDEVLLDYRLQHLGASESWDEYWDEVSGGALPVEQVRKARAEEVAFMEGWGCWTRLRC